MTLTSEKLGLDDPSSSFSQPPKAPTSPLTSLYGRFTQWRKSLDLPNPGTVENLQKEVKRMSPKYSSSSP